MDPLKQINDTEDADLSRFFEGAYWKAERHADEEGGAGSRWSLPGHSMIRTNS